VLTTELHRRLLNESNAGVAAAGAPVNSTDVSEPA